MSIKSNQDTTPPSAFAASQSKILKHLAHKLTDDYFTQKAGKRKSAAADDQVDHLDDFIRQSSSKLADSFTSADSDPVVDEVDRFNGLDSPEEELTLLKEKLKHIERENLKLKHQLDLLKTDYDAEKKQLSQTIRDLKSELHRTAPLTDNKFFSFSKDLRDVVNQVKSLSTQDMNPDTSPDATSVDDLDLPITPDTLPPVEYKPIPKGVQSSPPTPSSNSSGDANADQEAKPEPAKPSSPNQKHPTSKKRKVVMTAATVAAIGIFALGTVLFMRQPTVDQNLIATNQANGAVQGASDEPAPSPTPTLARKEYKNNQVTFEDTQWETFRDEFLGFQVRYPGNATDLLHTGNTITFLRKDGYLFKMQRLQTTETAAEYWQRIQEDSLKYDTQTTTFAYNPALHLTLQEEVDYPGNRYLVKVNDHLYDVWYAIDSADHYEPDDIKRVNFMLESVRFL